MAKLELSKSDTHYIIANYEKVAVEQLLEDLGFKKTQLKELKKYIESLPKSPSKINVNAKSTVLEPLSKEEQDAIFKSEYRKTPDLVTYTPKI